MKKIVVFTVFILLFAQSGHADKGPIIWQDSVNLVQEAQKAIIAHNGADEALILGTEMKASGDAEILEFIPFPAEPAVGLAKGDPFAAISRLITRKNLVFYRGVDSAVKGGGPAGPATAPVEIRLSQKIGLHDVTVIKINDVREFRQWCEKYFADKGIRADNEKLFRAYDNARDYTQRGYTYFVFDRVRVTSEVKFVEPLLYSFKTRNIYYPLKTSNLIGGVGTVELVFLLPGSIMDDVWQQIGAAFDMSLKPAVELSSSSKVYHRELHTVGLPEGFFGSGGKIYMQVLRYKGVYAFKGDFLYDIARLKPYGYRFESTRWHGDKEFTPAFTQEEVRDLKEFFCPKSSDPAYMFEGRDYNLDCWNFISSEEYEIYAAIFRNPPSGIPRRQVSLGRMTSKMEAKNKKLPFQSALIKDFNEKNRTSMPLENAFADDDSLNIMFADDRAGTSLTGGGTTYVSRVGFCEDGSAALVHIDHVAGPRSGVSYYISLRKKSGGWVVEKSVQETIH